MQQAGMVITIGVERRRPQRWVAAVATGHIERLAVNAAPSIGLDIIGDDSKVHIYKSTFQRAYAKLRCSYV
jgi:hypothetical protein